MDLFEKCDHFETLKQVRKLGIYPYFHELPRSFRWRTIA